MYDLSKYLLRKWSILGKYVSGNLEAKFGNGSGFLDRLTTIVSFELVSELFRFI